MSEQQTERDEFRVQRPDGSIYDAHVMRMLPDGAVVRVGAFAFPVLSAVLPHRVEPGAVLRVSTSIVKFPTAEEGQDLLEYGLLAALIALVAVGAVSAVGQAIYTVFWQSIATNF